MLQPHVSLVQTSEVKAPVLIGVGPNASELNEKITRSGRNQLQLLGCVFVFFFTVHGCGGFNAVETDVWALVVVVGDVEAN